MNRLTETFFHILPFSRNSEQFQVQNITNFLHLAKSLKGIPFDFVVENSSNIELRCRINVVQSKWHLVIWKFLCYLELFYCVFLWVDFCFYYSTYIEKKEYFQLILGAIWTLAFTCCFALITHQLFRYKAIATCTNQLFSLSNIIKVPGSTSDFKKIWRNMNLLVVLMRLNALSGTLFCCLLFWIFPNHRRYCYSHLPSDWQIFWVKVIYCVFEGLSMTYAWHMFIMIVLFLGMYMYIMNASMRSLKRSDVSQFSFFYQILRIISLSYYEAYGTLGLPPLKIAWSSTGLFCLAASIKLFGKVNSTVIIILIIFGLTAGSTLGLLLPMAGSLFQNSEEAIEQFKSRLTSVEGYKKKELRMYGKAFPQVGIRMAWFYIIERKTTLTFFAIMLNFLVNILVTLDEY